VSTVETVNGIMEKYGVDVGKAKKEENLGKDAFLTLLITQMQYQDPLEPTKNEDFLAQMAQFSALEQMQNLNTSSTMQQAYDLIGKTIIGAVTNEATKQVEPIKGTVDSVILKNGVAYLKVDGKELALSKVEAVLNEGTVATQSELIEAIDKINALLKKIESKMDQVTNQENASNDTTE